MSHTFLPRGRATAAPSGPRPHTPVSGWRRAAVVSMSVVALSGASVAAGSAASAASASPTHGRAPVSVSITAPASTSLAPAPAGAASVRTSWAGAETGVVKRNPFIRVAVKAALAAIKARSRSTYDQIINWVYLGRSYFISAYENYAPGWVKTLMPGVAAGALYDAIKWVIGL